MHDHVVVPTLLGMLGSAVIVWRVDFARAAIFVFTPSSNRNLKLMECRALSAQVLRNGANMWCV